MKRLYSLGAALLCAHSLGAAVVTNYISLLPEKTVPVNTDVVPMVNASGVANKVKLGNFVPMPASAGLATEIWFAARTDGLAGDGTQRNPFDGSTQAKLDAILAARANTANIHVHLGPGTFQTNGSSAWLAYDGWKILGAGKTQTKLQMIHIVANAITAVITPTAGHGTEMEVANLTIDCQYQTLVTGLSDGGSHGIEAVSAASGYLHDLDIYNAGGTVETFICGFFSYNIATAPALCLQERIRCFNMTNQATCIWAHATNASNVDTAPFGGTAIIRDCYVSGDDTGGIAYQINGFNYALLQGCTATGMAFGFYRDTTPVGHLVLEDNYLTSDNTSARPIAVVGNATNAFTSNVTVRGNTLVGNNLICQMSNTSGVVKQASIYNNLFKPTTSYNNFYQPAQLPATNGALYDNRFDPAITNGGGTLSGATFIRNNRYFDNSKMPFLQDTNGSDAATVVYVNKISGSDTFGVRNDSQQPFKTIAQGITSASAGDTVVVQKGSGVYNETVSAKDQITLVFEPGAQLNRSTNDTDVIHSSATNQTFTVWSLYSPILHSSNGGSGILSSHSGAVLNIHGDTSNTGTVTTNGVPALNASAGTINNWGNVFSTNDLAVAGSGGAIVQRGDCISTSAFGVSRSGGTTTIIGGKVSGTRAAGIIADAGQVTFIRDTLVATTSTLEAVLFFTNGSFKPIFRDCVFISGTSASFDSLASGGAQNVLFYGANVANKGSSTPANITKQGGGTYVADSNVVSDL